MSLIGIAVYDVPDTGELRFGATDGRITAGRVRERSSAAPISLGFISTHPEQPLIHVWGRVMRMDIAIRACLLSSDS
jgi:hypothetical protein